MEKLRLPHLSAPSPRPRTYTPIPIVESLSHFPFGERFVHDYHPYDVSPTILRGSSGSSLFSAFSLFCYVKYCPLLLFLAPRGARARFRSPDFVFFARFSPSFSFFLRTRYVYAHGYVYGVFPGNRDHFSRWNYSTRTKNFRREFRVVARGIGTHVLGPVQRVVSYNFSIMHRVFKKLFHVGVVWRIELHCSDYLFTVASFRHGYRVTFSLSNEITNLNFRTGRMRNSRWNVYALLGLIVLGIVVNAL